MSHIITKRLPLFGTLLFMIAFAISAPAVAHNYCVSTADALRAALLDAQTPPASGGHNGEDNGVSIVVGMYAANGQPFSYNSTAATGYLIIQGGAPPNCIGATDPDASHTILTGASTSKVLKLLNKASEIIVQGLTIEYGNSTDGGGGLDINTEGGYNDTVIVERCIIRNNHSDSLGGGFYIGADGSGKSISFQQNVVYQNTADSIGGAAGYFTSSGASIGVSTNTIAQNTASGSGKTGGIIVSTSSGSSGISGNIFWNNNNSSLQLATTNASLYFNDYDAISGSLPHQETGTSLANPQFHDSVDNDYRLNGDSPLLGTSQYLIGPNTDVLGNEYPSHGFADFGAYAETIFRDGFDPPPPPSI
jgi:hypothetical protein